MSTLRPFLIGFAIIALRESGLKAQMADAMGDVRQTTLRGFADVDYITGGLRSSRKSAFALGQFDLFITSKLTDRLSFLSESVFEFDDTSSEFVVDIERLAAQFAINEHLRVVAGKVHTPLGYWNNAYHHGLVMQPTIERPQLVSFEDDGGPLPIHTVGIQLSGRDLTEAHLGFDVLLGNGLGNRPSADNINNSQALTVAIHSQVTSDLRIGLSGYRDKLAPGSPNLRGGAVEAPMTQTTGGGFLAYVGSRAEVIVEGDRVSNASMGRTSNSPGWFAYSGLRIRDNFVPYFTHEDLKLSDNDPYFIAQHTRREIIGIRYEQAATAVYKLEFRNAARVGVPRATELAAQLAVAF
jgi:hypothetical protein